jgi:hypothetical protein
MKQGADGMRPFAKAVLLLGAMLFSFACSDDKKASKPDAGPGLDQRVDTIECKRPPFSLCVPPGTPSCPTYWSCKGCNCAGATRVAACNPITQDCRYFCTGCYPDEYVSCSDPTAAPTILSRCGYCFLSDAGGPERCNQLKDAGP